MSKAKFQIRQTISKSGADLTNEFTGQSWYYVLVGANGEVMLTSEHYGTEKDAMRGANDAKKASSEATVTKR